MLNADPPLEEPQGTVRALLEAGLLLFGTQGFAGTSTRDLAARAQTNVASIAYHFGGKAGLREACAREFVRRLGTVFAQTPPLAEQSPEAAAEAIRQILRQMARFALTSEAARALVSFALREIAENGRSAEIIYENLIRHVQERLCALWAMATGEDPGAESVRLRVFTFLGQMLYFRIGGPIVTRHLGWAEIGPEEAERILDILIGNFDAALAAARRV